jgi:hypothetical protein
VLSVIASPAPPVPSWACELVVSLEKEAIEADPRARVPGSFVHTDTGRRIDECSRGDQAELVVATLLRLKDAQDSDRARDPTSWRRQMLLTEVAAYLLRRRLPYSEERLASIIAYCSASLVSPHHHSHLAPLLRQIEYVADQAAGGASGNGALAAAVVLLSEEAIKSPGLESSVRAALARLAARLTSDGSQLTALAPGPWRDKVLAEIRTLADEPAAISRRALVHAAGAVGKSKPSDDFLKVARSLLAEDRALAARVLGWIEAHVPEAAKLDPNDDVIRGLIWMLATTDQEGFASRIGTYCELCFKKVSAHGVRSMKLGNGALQTLGMLGGPHAVAELTRLKARAQYPFVVTRIEATLSEVAARLGLGESELEEMALPTFGLSTDGERRLPVGDGMAAIRVTGARDVQLIWVRSDGKEVASIPKAFKEAAPEAVAAVRSLKKEIEGALGGQRARIERLYLSERRIAFDLWRERYLEHPLIADLTRRLIWRFESSGKHVAGLVRNGAIEDVAGRPIEPTPDITVTLWHPLHATASDVLDWRKRLAALGITQPFKQAHREVYVVTDAERQTVVYSNRFSAHVLNQYQFKALCNQRGWRYRLLGPLQPHNTPTRTLPGQRLSVEFWVNDIDDPNGARISTLISTDQVRFVELAGELIPMRRVPPLVFSELMRDVELFVNVASVGNDPNWVDGGPRRRFQAYWTDYAFGKLNEAGKTRASVLAALLPQLAIAGQCSLEDRFLVVRGKLRTYRIHLGSANIRMDPNNQYLCIVPARGQSYRSDAAESLLLPFEGDIGLSIILSKAFLLAADDEITDVDILRQIEHA